VSFLASCLLLIMSMFIRFLQDIILTCFEVSKILFILTQLPYTSNFYISLCTCFHIVNWPLDLVTFCELLIAVLSPNTAYIGSTTFSLVVNTNAPHYFTHFYKFKHDKFLAGWSNMATKRPYVVQGNTPGEPTSKRSS
jgi:hypothetical protein